MADEVALYKRALERERKARKAAEKTLEEKSYELYLTNESLRELNTNLEVQVKARTEELAESESRFRLIIESASDIIYRSNYQGYFIYANPLAEKKTGYSLEELKKMHFTGLVEKGFQEEVQGFYARQKEEKRAESYLEFPISTKSGEVIWLGQNVHFSFNEDGTVEQISAVARDITNSKEGQSRLENLVANIQSAVVLEDARGKVLLPNKFFCDFFGFDDPKELIGKDGKVVLKRLAPFFEEEQTFVKEAEALLKSRKEDRQKLLVLKDGRAFRRDFIPIRHAKQYMGQLWIYTDVTSQQENINLLQASEEKYRGIIANMNLGLIEVDMDEKIQFVNQSFLEMSGYSASELIGKEATKMFLSGENAKSMQEKNRLRTKGVSDAYEVTVKNKRGQAMWWLISGAPLYDSQGQLTGSIGIHLDITLQKQLETELNQARNKAESSARAREVFLATMSHEIRTPMNGVLGMTRQLKKTSLDQDQQFYLGTISAAAEHLMIILNDILDLSKIEAGKLSVENKPFGVEEVFDRTRNILLPKAEEKGVKLSFKMDSNVSQLVEGDAHRLHQVLLNLAGNAIKFTDKGSVNLSCTLKKDRSKAQIIAFEVKDTGIGMDEEYIQNIFEKFSQEDESTARKYGGTGLGMSISNELVQLMGGQMQIESRKGSGTKITFELDLKKATTIPDKVAVKTEENPLAEFYGKHFLLAEDNQINQLVVQAALDHAEIKLSVVENGSQALDFLHRNEVDLVLMDVNMPIMDGHEATRLIRQDLGENLPVIALTANAMKSSQDECLAAGMNATLTKPFEEEDLYKLLKVWLGKASESKMNPISENISNQAEGAFYSLKKIEKISRGNPDFVLRMLEIFQTQSVETVRDLNLAVKEKDHEKVRQLAHRFKPSLDTLSVGSFTDKIRRLEQLGIEKGDWNLIEKLIEELEEIVARLNEALVKEQGFLKA